MKNALSFCKPTNLFGFNDDWFDDFKDPFFGISKTFTNSPKVNIKETDKAYEIEIANPGFTKDETKIKIEDGVLYVSMISESKDDKEDEHKYHVHQWSKSAYHESWGIPENVIEEQINAKNNDGVLVITLPKKEEEPKQIKSRTIEIG